MYELSQPVGSDKKEYRHKIVFLGHRRQPGTWLERPLYICSIANTHNCANQLFSLMGINNEHIYLIGKQVKLSLTLTSRAKTITSKTTFTSKASIY